MTEQPPNATPLDRHDMAGRMAACGIRSTGGDARIAVAVSGGADSLALALLTHDWGRAHGVGVVALTVDHGLRVEAAAEAAQVAAWLGERGIEHHILTWHHGGTVSSAVQARAREARYGLMRDWCVAHGVGELLTAHHLGDQAETVLMRLSKGTGLMGLAGMAKRRDLDGVALVRPFLSVPKARLVATLEAAAQDWIEDPSNSDLVYERVRTRALLAHLQGEGVTAERLGRVADAAGRVREVLQRAAETLLVQDGGALSIEAKAFAAAPEPVAHVALTKALQQVGGGAYPPHRDKLSRLCDWMRADVDKASRRRTLAGCLVVLKGGCFHFLPEAARKRPHKRQNAAINCETALAPGAQKTYIQGNSGPIAAQV